MAPPKLTKMVMDVDLNCSDCYKKVKKLICKIPEIRDQEYDIDKNKVKISVVCCSPDRIRLRDKLCNKGGSSIQKIELVVDKPTVNKPKEPAGNKPKSKEPEKPKADDKPKAAPPVPPPKSDPSPKPEVAKMIIEPVHGYPQNHAMIGYGYGYEGYGGPHAYGMHVAPPQSYGYEYGYNQNHGYNGNAAGHYTSNDYFSEENPQGCSIM